MRIKKSLLGAALLLPAVVAAQSSSINTFSPYTLYGIGDLATQGPTYIRSMGGAGVAYRDVFRLNYLNPAAATASGQKSFIFNFGLEGSNYYLKSSDAKSSFNTFNIRDIGVQFPLGRLISASVSVTPMSTVGYRITATDENPATAEDFKRIDYLYEGSGGLTQGKAGLGVVVTPKLSLGAEAVYYLGNINRSYTISFVSFDGEQPNDIYGTEKNQVSQIYFNFGVQYSPVMTDRRLLTLGATFQPGGRLNPHITRQVPSGNINADTISYNSRLSDFRMPDMMTVGVAYRTPKIGLVADYSYQGWNCNNGSDMEKPDTRYRNTSSFKLGTEYTPNRLDVRRYLNRVTYRAGLRYADDYIQFNGRNVSEKALTLGLGFPLRASGYSAINVGFEAGTRGTTSHNLIRENYFKFSIGLSLFGEDYWFRKRQIE